MPRKPRLQAAGLPVHIIQRGNNRQACFFCRGGLSILPRSFGEIGQALSLLAACVCAYDQPFPLVADLRSGFRSVAAHEVPRPALRPVCEPYLETQWLFMGGAIPIEPGADGALCPRLLSLYRTEPGTGQYGEALNKRSGLVCCIIIAMSRAGPARPGWEPRCS